jgi:mannose-1-phosphate guanylyltransferase
VTGSFHAIIPAGGSGTRLWPLSRAERPKFLLDVTGSGRSLVQLTWDRLVPLTGPDGITLVCGQAHESAIREQLPDLTHLIAEPSPRDSMPAIGLAAALIVRRDRDAVIGSFAADHLIDDVPKFHAAVDQAITAAREGLIATIGIKPEGPSSAFGYIESGEKLTSGALAVSRFVEKPDTATAQQYLDHGGFFWNAGMFVTRADVILRHLGRLQPTLHEHLTAIAQAWDSPARASVLAEHWPATTKIAIDHALAEPVSLEGGMAVVPGDFGWSDIGDYLALSEISEPDPDCVFVDADGLVTGDGGQFVAVLGIDDAVVVRTKDAILVTTKARAQDVKQVVATLKSTARTDLL